MLKNDVLEAIAEALKKGGIKAAYNFPGFNSHKLFDYLGDNITSTNEKIAYEIAWGSSQAGKPTVVTFKNVGLNDAADPFINSILTGVGAGLVLVVFDDIELEGSQCILDSRHYFDFYGGLWLEPFNLASARSLAESAAQLSCIFDMPVVIRLTNHMFRFIDDRPFVKVEHIVKLAERVAGQKLANQKSEPIVHPINGEAQQELIMAKNRSIQRFVNNLHRLSNEDGVKGVVYCGYNTKKADSHIFTLPVPTVDINKVKSVNEVGDKIIAKELMLQATTANFTSNNASYNSKNSNNYIVSSRYERLFYLLKREYSYIAGDLGEYTKDSLQTLTHCLCFGSAISVVVGMSEAGKKALAITGDASFYHSAKNVIDEAKLRKIPIKVVLLDNGGSQGTGGQKIPGSMPTDIDITEIDLDTITDKSLSRTVDNFVNSTEAVILKVNHSLRI